MKKLLIGCDLMKPELSDIIERYHIQIDTLWLDEDLHNHPNKLHDVLQETIDSVEGYDEVLLGYGLCGNALADIKATSAKLTYLRTDDCINCLMKSNPGYEEIKKDTIFVSRCWLGSKKPFNSEYEYALERYGQKRTERIYKSLYEHYNRVVYMQTEESVPTDMIDAAEDMAEKLNLPLSYMSADTGLYEKLLKGEEHRFITHVPQGDSIQIEHFLD